MDYEIRLATDDDIVPALDLAWRMFVKFDSPDYGVEHTERMREAIEDRLKDLSIYTQRLLVVASGSGHEHLQCGGSKRRWLDGR